MLSYGRSSSGVCQLQLIVHLVISLQIAGVICTRGLASLDLVV